MGERDQGPAVDHLRLGYRLTIVGGAVNGGYASRAREDSVRSRRFWAAPQLLG